MKFGFHKWLAFAVIPISALAQGTFSNLGFESATIIEKLNGVDAHAALPSWAVYYGSSSAINTIFYNDRALDSWMVSIHDAASTFRTPISGRFSVFIQSGRILPDIRGPAAIAQTGTIPLDARSLLFSATLFGHINVSFDGELLASAPLITNPNFTTYGVDITTFAGQTGELRFETAYPNAAFIDDIRFSPNVVPEPKVIALLLIGGIALSKRGGRATARQRKAAPHLSR